MKIVKQYGFERGGVVADWACEICQRIVYPKTNYIDVKGVNDFCDRCKTSMKISSDLADEWWKIKPDYFSKTSHQQGVYALRDDLQVHLIFGDTSDRLKKYAKRIHRDLPSVGS